MISKKVNCLAAITSPFLAFHSQFLFVPPEASNHRDIFSFLIRQIRVIYWRIS